MSQKIAQSKNEGLGVLACLAALATLATNIILPAFGDIGRSMLVPTQSLAITLSAFFVPFAVGQLIVGPASDRFGRRKLMFGGLAILILGSVICAVAVRMESMVLGRMIQGLGACVPSVLARSIARDRFEGVALSRALSFIMVAMAAAPGFSPLAGGLITNVAGWRSVFWLVAALTLLTGFFYAARIGETLSPALRRKISIATICRGYLQLLRDCRFIAPAIAVGLTSASLMAFFSATPEILMEGLSLSPIELGYFFAATVFIVFGAGIAAPKLAFHWGASIVSIVGSVMALAGGIVLLSGPMGLLHFGFSISIFLLGAGLLNPLGTAMALQPFGAQAGMASALLGFLQMGMATLAVTATTLFDGATYRALGCVLAASMIMALFSLMMSRRNPLSANSQT